MEDLTKAVEDLQRQLQHLMDEREITRLLISLSRLVDEKDFDGLAEIYATNGSLVTPWGGHTGRSGLADFIRNDIGHFKEMHHVGAGVEVEVEPGANTARARMTLLATHVLDDDSANFTTVGGYYSLELIREDGQWRILRNIPNPQWRFSTSGNQANVPQKGRWMPERT